MWELDLTKVNNRPTFITIEYIIYFYTVDVHVQSKRPSCKVVYFCQVIDVIFRLYGPFLPLDPRRPLHMLYIYIMTLNCPKGILGLGGKASKNKMKDTSFIFSMTNITILSIFRTHAQKEHCKVLETKGIYILNNLVFYFLKTYNGFTKILV